MNIKTLFLVIQVFIIFNSSLAQNNKLDGRNLNIVFIGNSITYGGGLKDPSKEAPPVRAVEWLRNKRNVGDVSFKNMGFSGHTTVDFLPGGPYDFKKVVTAASSFKDKDAQLVFSMILGTNDSAVQGPKGAPVSPKNYEENLHAIADQLLKEFPGCKLIFQQPIWYSPNTHNRSLYGAEGLARLQSYFPIIREVVKSYHTAHPGQVFMGDGKAFKFFKKNAEIYFQHEQGVDGVFLLHPNKQGAVKLGEFWAKAIYKRLLK
ncbi:GDSL-type esterase/lipase family protein [Desertivirga arenae]|uniref:GDSL-type esterase/lipase family protein n=1 Tax=Desertivirga arenae TaxID=2810309 RepID=UPI001A96EAF9|nr:GDSL-type esterase/lipase family protein [Pedobacter sp. SYSU D00823]